MQFGGVAGGGRYEKCKKHTFFGFITILEENLFNKNCSQLKNRKIQKNFFPEFRFKHFMIYGALHA